MSSDRLVVTTRPICVAKTDAAALLGMSVDSFERYAQPDLRVIRRGRMRLFPVADLEQWAHANAEHVLPSDTGGPDR